MDLLFRTLEGAEQTGVSSATTYGYDPNGNLVEVFDDDGNPTPTAVADSDCRRHTLKKLEESVFWGIA